jgi:hypothetical protein
MYKFGLRVLAVTTVSAATLAMSAVTATAVTSVGTSGVTVEQECHDDGDAAARGGRALDHRSIGAKEQRRIEARTDRILDRRGISASRARQAAATVPVYVHVMAGSAGQGDVSDAQIADQIDVLNATFAGAESGEAANTGFSFTLAGTDRFYNNTWHRDGASSKYRKATRQGGADALNIWLVDFNYLGIATFPWDYSRNAGIDGIRVHYASLPGGDATNFNLGETATHEAGHWFGLYHTFQGGCTTTNDEVADTPAQGGPSSGCPVGADTCSLPGTDPIHNYMDYSYDSCYNQFTQGQSSRMSQMWTAYRG